MTNEITTAENWEIVIGLEIHAQVASKAKLFSGSPTTAMNEETESPNSRVSFFDAGMPGMLPVINSFCIDQAIKTGLGIHGTINRVSVFDRKNYFYPDQPTGYQISQFFYPIVSGGYVDLIKDGESRRFRINRIHLEQDAGKSIHDIDPKKSYIDLNRAGIALMEIVTEPDMRSVDQAVDVAKKIHQLVQYLETCHGNMEQGNFRIDANVSIHRPGTPFGTRVEIKNLNSFTFMRDALNYEIARHKEVLENSGTIVQETRLFDTVRGITAPMRDKEDACDYRYFPDPDLPPLVLDPRRIDFVKADMPELPDDKRVRFKQEFGLNDYDIDILILEKAIAEFFDEAVSFKGFKDPKAACKLIANWMIVELFAAMKKDNIASIKQIGLTPTAMAKLVALIQDGTISGKIAKTVFEEMWKCSENEPSKIIERLGLKQISSEEELLPAIRQILQQNEKQVTEFKNGKESLFGFFVGQVMKHFRGQANPEMVNKLLKKALAE